MNFKIFKILYKLNHLKFWFTDINAMLLIVLEVHFSQHFSNNAYLGRILRSVKIGLSLFSHRSVLLGNNVPNDSTPFIPKEACFSCIKRAYILRYASIPQSAMC